MARQLLKDQKSMRHRGLDKIRPGPHRGVSQITVLGPMLFLLQIDDLPENVKSHVRLFADDCLLYRPIRSQEDQIVVQEDLDALVEWCTKWGMHFNVKKCISRRLNPIS